MFSVLINTCKSLNSNSCKCVWCEIYVKSIGYFLIAVCYRSQEADESELGEMFESTKLACNANRSVPIMGDYVCISTRCNNILDLILMNEMPIKDDICVLSPVDNSDHNVLTFSIDCNISQEKEKRHLCYNHKTTNVCMNLLN